MPPKAFCVTAFEYCPLALLTFFYLWKLDGKYEYYTTDIVRDEIKTTFVKFREDLRRLAGEDLLTYEVEHNTIKVKLSRLNINCNGLTLC